MSMWVGWNGIRGFGTAALLGAMASPLAAVEVFHCRDADGTITLTDMPCAAHQIATVVSIEVSEAPGEGLRATELQALEAMEASMAQRRSIRASQLIANTSRAAAGDSEVVERDRRYPVLVGPLVGRSLRHGSPRCTDCGVTLRRRPSGAPRPSLNTPDLFSTPLPSAPHRTVIHGRVNF